MKTINTFEDCSKCKDCCKFAEDEKDYGPILTSKEMKRIKERFWDVKIIKHNGSKNVYRVELIESGKEKGIYVCPFLVEENYYCRIYDLLPFDCKLWPFILIKTNEKNCINLACYEKRNCPSLQKIPEKEFNEYKKYLIELLNSDKYKNMIKKHPDLAWVDEDDVFYVEKIKI